MIKARYLAITILAVFLGQTYMLLHTLEYSRVRYSAGLPTANFANCCEEFHVCVLLHIDSDTW